MSGATVSGDMRMGRLSLAAAAAVLLVAASAASRAADWPEYHGPRRDNKSTETGLLKSWPEGGPKLLWTASGLGKGYTPVSVAKGMIYTAGMVDKRTFVFAFDLNGRMKWRSPNGESWQASERMRHATSYGGSRGTPTVKDGVAYHLGDLGRLTAFRADTGRELWTVDMLERFDAKRPSYGLCESVLIDGENVICSPGGAKGYMVALDRKTARTSWVNTEIKDRVGFSSLVVAEFGGIRQLVTMSADAVFAVDAKTGRLLWRVGHRNRRGNNATDVIYSKPYVYASSGYGKGSILLRLKRTEGGIAAEKVWENDLLDSLNEGVILHDGHLYGSGYQKGGRFCLDFMTGGQKYRSEGPAKGSLTYADGMLYCLGERGTMSLVRATPAAYEVVSSFGVPSGGSGKYWAHPVVCGGRLYIRHADRLYAYDVSAR